MKFIVGWMVGNITLFQCTPMHIISLLLSTGLSWAEANFNKFWDLPHVPLFYSIRTHEQKTHCRICHHWHVDYVKHQQSSSTTMKSIIGKCLCVDFLKYSAWGCLQKVWRDSISKYFEEKYFFVKIMQKNLLESTCSNINIYYLWT